MKTKNEKQKKNTSHFGLTEVILLVLLTCILSLGFGYYLGKDPKAEEKEEDKYLERFKTNYDYILENYYEKIDKDNLIDSAIRGMVESLGDIHSEFMTESESNTFDITLNGQYEGVGMTVANNKEGNIVVVEVMENSPAGKAGVQIGDIVKQIDKENMKEVPTTTLTSYIKEHKTFKLILERNEKEIELKLTKEKIILPSATSKIIEREGKKIGYIKISIFALNTADQFEKEIKALEKEGITSLIIDVRDNGGGHLISAKQIISSLIDSSKVMYQLKSKKETTKVYAEGKKTKTYPMVVLTNQNAASGSELLTAALKENNIAISVGTKTYGKGTVQELKNLSTGSEYKVTTKKWLTPKGNDINGKGIDPDIEVEASEKYLQANEEVDDNQLEAALEYLKTK